MSQKKNSRSPSPTNQKNLKIAFIHPELGIGGAESLVVCMAMALQEKGHKCTMYSPQYDPNYCYPEVAPGGPLDVSVHGSWIPRNIAGKYGDMMQYMRMFICSLYVAVFGHYDLIIVDQVPIGVPILRLFGKKVLFYCHFPEKCNLYQKDKLPFIEKTYRIFLDFIEELCYYFANLILMNSKFTQETFYESFPKAKRWGIKSNVVYPSINLKKIDEYINSAQNEDFLSEYPKDFQPGKYFMSLNRFDIKKNIALAVKAFAEFKKMEHSDGFKLILAGGYDSKIPSVVQYTNYLEKLAKELGIENDVLLRKSISDQEKAWLIKNAYTVLYTPEGEHFGIVPVEAMYQEKPIIAHNSGGPLESVQTDEKVGFLCSNDPMDWAKKFNWLAGNPEKAAQMGKIGRQRVIDMFSFENFGNQVAHYVNQVLAPRTVKAA